MSIVKASIFIFALLICTSPAHAASDDAILGVWNTPDGDAKFEIYKCGFEYCGKISWLEEPYYPPTKSGLAGRLKMDLKNPDPALRKRTLLGMPLIEGLRFEGGNSWRGTIYNPEDGNKYKCRLSIAGDRLMVRGYLGIVLLGRTQTWTRETEGS
ncbi:MAG: DUF2147 domain-containing protein [Syntrophobacter sp.]